MPTLDQLVDEVKSNLQGYTLRQDRISYITNSGGIDTTDTSITIGSSGNLAKGVIEIDDELIWIDSFNKSSNTLTVAPGFGRGYLGTAPAPHDQYAQVTLSPTFPRNSIKKAINDTIRSLFPKVYAVGSTTFTFNATQIAYALPDDVRDVIYVSWDTSDSTQEWLPVRRWRFDGMANTASFNTQKTINIYSNIESGRTVKVWYSMVPNTLDANSDDFVDVTGLPDSCQDVVVYGACHRLLSFLDAGRINLTSAESDLNDTKIPSSAGASVSKYVFALYQQRLQEEAFKLSTQFPIRIHLSR